MLGIPSRRTPKEKPSPPLLKYELGPGFSQGAPWPWIRRIFSSSVIVLSTRLARSSGVSLVFIHGKDAWWRLCAHAAFTTSAQNRTTKPTFHLLLPALGSLVLMKTGISSSVQ